MNKPTLLVVRTPTSEEDKQKFEAGLALLEPYRMTMSQHAEQSVLEFISVRRYVAWSRPHHEAQQQQEQQAQELSAEETEADVSADPIQNRAFVAGLAGVGGIGLFMLMSNKFHLSSEAMLVGVGISLAVSALIAWPLLFGKRKS